MKAIQVKLIAPTAKQPARLKAWSDSGSMVESVDSGLDLEMQVVGLCIQYTSKIWDNTVQISGFGVLPNDDWVATVASNLN